MTARAEADRRAYEATSNPFYLWQAISRCRPDELPMWVCTALVEAAPNILATTVPTRTQPCPPPPREALQAVLRALGFVRPGWNAVAAFRRDREDGFVATLYRLTVRKGRTKQAAADLGEPRSALRRVARALRLRR